MLVIAGCGGADDNATNGTNDTDAVTTADGTDTATDGANETETETETETEMPGNATDGADNETNVSGNASLRVAHLSPDAPSVDVLVDGEPIAENVSFGNLTDYIKVAPGEYRITIAAANNSSMEVFNQSVTLGGAAYTAAAIGEIGENGTQPFEVLILEDRTEQPSTSAAARLVHAAPDAGAVDVTINTSGMENANNETMVLFDNVTFGTATEYVEVPAGTYNLDIREATADNDGTVVATNGVTVKNGTTYSAYAAGYVVPEPAWHGNTPFDLVVMTDGMTGTNGTGGNVTDGNRSTSASIAPAPLE